MKTVKVEDTFDLDVRIEVYEDPLNAEAAWASGDCTDTCHTQPNCLDVPDRQV